MEKTAKKVTFARWGNYTIAIKALFESLGFEVILPQTTNKTIAEGVKYAPELFCFPMKILLGNYMEAIRQGADTIFSAENCTGSCRQRYYGAVQEKILKECGHNINFINMPLSPKRFVAALKKYSGKPLKNIFYSLYFCYLLISVIEKIEKRLNYLRPRELKAGDAGRAGAAGFKILENVKNLKELAAAKNEIAKLLKSVQFDGKKQIPRVGILGEIYGVTEAQINFGVEQKLGKQGIDITRQMSLLYQIRKLVFPWKDFIIGRKAKGYLGSSVGGHGRDAVAEMLHFAKDGFDGVIQILPFGCMPEVTVRPVLEKIRKESGMPFLSLSIDEQVAEAGIATRLEAFGDVVFNHYRKNRKS